jgi:hypothetical protein
LSITCSAPPKASRSSRSSGATWTRRWANAATGYATTQAGTAGQIADYLEEIFEATGSRGGFMLGHSQCGPRDQLRSIAGLLVPKLQQHGRFRAAYTGQILRDNLAG